MRNNSIKPAIIQLMETKQCDTICRTTKHGQSMTDDGTTDKEVQISVQQAVNSAVGTCDKDEMVT